MSFFLKPFNQALLHRFMTQTPGFIVICVATVLVAGCPSCASRPKSSELASEVPPAPATEFPIVSTNATPPSPAVLNALVASEASEPTPNSVSTNVALAKPATPSALVDSDTATTNSEQAEQDIEDDISTNAMEDLDDRYKLAIGDTINYQVLEDRDDPKTIPVTDSGDIEVPYMGRFPATGKTCKQLAEQLKVELQKKYYFRATVVVSVNSMASQGVIYLVGGVKAPGPMEIPRDDLLTISKAILRAGGFDDFADEKHVRITRKGDSGSDKIITVNVSAILDQGKIDQDVQIQPGDLIYVPEKTFRF